MRRERIFKTILILVNLAGVIAGFYYYAPQLSRVHPLLWFFVPDCPLYLLFFVIILVVKTPEWVEGLISAGMIKYAAWSMFYYFLHPQTLFLFPSIAGLFGHGLMVFQALHFLHKSTIDWRVTLSWFFFNDALDYFAGTRPLVVNELFRTSLLSFSVIATVVVAYLKSKELPSMV